MPYKVSKSGSGFKVRNKNTGKTYSKKPMSKERAEDQMAAIYANTNESLNNLLDDSISEMNRFVVVRQGNQCKIATYLNSKPLTEDLCRLTKSAQRFAVSRNIGIITDPKVSERQIVWSVIPKQFVKPAPEFDSKLAQALKD